MDSSDAVVDGGIVCIVDIVVTSSGCVDDGCERDTRFYVLVDASAVYHYGFCVCHSRYSCRWVLYDSA